MASVAFSPSTAASEVREAKRFAFAKLGVATVIAAMLANTLVYFIGDAIVGYDKDFVVLSTIGGTYFFTGISAIIAVLVYAAVLRFATNPARTYTIIAAVVLALSVIPDFTYIPTVEGSSNAQTAVLVIMHVVAAVVITGLLSTYRRQRDR
jgi:hypothetical protein